MAKSSSTMGDSDKPVKVDKWDGSALKNALDDHTKKVFKEKLMFIESFRLMDGRLFLCTVSVGFALFAFVWDYLYPFPKSRSVLIACVVSYFVMMLVLTFYMTYIERGCFMISLEKDKAGIDPDNVWRLSSKLKRFDDKYELQMTVTDGATKEKRSASLVKSVCNFFNEDGCLCEKLFEDSILELQSSLTKDSKKE